MKHLLNCRRTFISFTAVVILGVALLQGHDTAMALAGVAASLSGANAFEKSKKPLDKSKES